MPKLFLNHLLYGTFASAVVMAMGALVLEATRWSPISTHKGPVGDVLFSIFFFIVMPTSKLLQRAGWDMPAAVLMLLGPLTVGVVHAMAFSISSRHLSAAGGMGRLRRYIEYGAILVMVALGWFMLFRAVV